MTTRHKHEPTADELRVLHAFASMPYLGGYYRSAIRDGELDVAAVADLLEHLVTALDDHARRDETAAHEARLDRLGVDAIRRIGGLIADELLVAMRADRLNARAPRRDDDAYHAPAPTNESLAELDMSGHCLCHDAAVCPDELGSATTPIDDRD